MRLWHYKLIPFLDRQHLLAQHRECCALRGNGWGRKHKTVDYVFKHNVTMLCSYHTEVMYEMHKRGYQYDNRWLSATYRGSKCQPFSRVAFMFSYGISSEGRNYPEHDEHYLIECLLNLLSKGYNNVVESFLSSKANDTHITMHTLDSYIYM